MLELDRAAGAPVVLKEPAALGFDLVSREERTELVEKVNRIVGCLAKAGGQLSQAVIEAAADNVCRIFLGKRWMIRRAKLGLDAA